MNKKILVSLAGAALLSFGLGTTTAKAANVISPNPTSTTTNKTSATTSDKTATNDGKTDNKSATTADNKTTTTTEYTLTHNSYTYDLSGKKIKTPTLKKGQSVKALGKVTINHVAYIQVSKNGYIKKHNVTPSKNVTKVRYSLNHNAYVYSAKGKRVNKKAVKKGKYVYVIGTKIIKGKNYVQISGSKSQFVKWANLDHDSAKVIVKK